MLGDQDWRGTACRAEVAHWPFRRRPAPHRTQGTTYVAEIDAPHVGEVSVPLGGRIFGPNGTFIEMDTAESDVLERDLQLAAEVAIERFLADRKLKNTVRDAVGAVMPEALQQMRILGRCTDTREFAANEAAAISRIAAVPDRIEHMRIDDDVFELRYPGSFGMPGRCLATVCRSDDNDKTKGSVVLLIGLRDGGTPPALMFTQLAEFIGTTGMLAGGDEAPTRWFVVEPDEFSMSGGRHTSEVTIPDDGDSRPVFQADPRLPPGYDRCFTRAIEAHAAAVASDGKEKM
jgi:hypothetical protein